MQLFNEYGRLSRNNVETVTCHRVFGSSDMAFKLIISRCLQCAVDCSSINMRGTEGMGY